MPDGVFSCPLFFFLFATKNNKKKKQQGESTDVLGVMGGKHIFPKTKCRKERESPSISISVRGDHRECESFHSLGNSQMTDLLFYTHRAKEKEKVLQKKEREGKRDGERERKGHRMKERDSRERGRGAGRRGL